LIACLRTISATSINVSASVHGLCVIALERALAQMIACVSLFIVGGLERFKIFIKVISG